MFKAITAVNQFLVKLTWIPLALIGVICLTVKFLDATPISWLAASSPLLVLGGMLVADAVLVTITNAIAGISAARAQRQRLDRMYDEMNS